MAQTATQIIATPLGRTAQLPAVPHAVHRWRLVLWLAGLALVVSLVAAAHLAQAASTQTTIYYLHRLRTERDVWQTRNEQLEVEMARVRSLAWVEHEAVTRLGMQKADKVIYMAVDPPAPHAVSSELERPAAP